MSFQSFSLRHLVKTKKRARKFTKKCDACAEMCFFFFFAYDTYRFFTLIYFLVARQPILSRYYRNSTFFIDNDDNQILLFYPRHEDKQSYNNKSNLKFPDISEEEGRLVRTKYRET